MDTNRFPKPQMKFPSPKPQMANGPKPQIANGPKPPIANGQKPPAYNTAKITGNMKNAVVHQYNKVYDYLANASYTLQVSLIILGILIILIGIYMIIVYYSYQVSVQQLISSNKIIDLSKTAVSEQYSIKNNNDNRFSTAFWLFTNGSNQGNPNPIQLLKCSKNYNNTEKIIYNLNNDIYNKLKDNVVGEPIYISNIREHNIVDDKLICTLFGNDLIVMIKPIVTSSNYLYFTFDYLPLSIWNHIAIVIESEYISLYLNGELYKSQSIKAIESVTKQQLSRIDSSFDKIILMPNTENANIDPSSLEGSYFAQLVFSDDALSMAQVQTLYDQSPYGSTFLSKLGYGLRSPVYKINDN